MNGRVQDPVLGRFLSADPFVPDPSNLQSFNRYSYVNNNPLSFTDPSGFFEHPIWAPFTPIIAGNGIGGGIAGGGFHIPVQMFRSGAKRAPAAGSPIRPGGGRSFNIVLIKQGNAPPPKPYGLKDFNSIFGGQSNGLGSSVGFPISNLNQTAKTGILSSPGAELAIGVLSFVALEAVTGILTTTVVGSPLAVLAQTAATARLVSLASKAKSFFAGFRTSKRGKRIVNLGGEGEVPGKGVINVQPGKINGSLELGHERAKEVRGIIDGVPGSKGQPIVRADGDRLPFRDKSIDKVYLNNAPLDIGTRPPFGPSFTTREINRILKDGGQFIKNGILQK